MKLLSRRNGFSLIELLTVIAIIAILAAIIFPVMSTVRDRARQSECMTNLHQIAMAAQMFKQDNRKFPDVLGAIAVDSNGVPITAPGSQVSFELAKAGGALFPEYTKSSTKVFHCSTSMVTDTKAVVPYTIKGATDRPVYTYSYDSYTTYYINSSTAPEQHYDPAWAYAADETGAIAAVSDSNCKAYEDPGNDTNDKKLADYERQLRFRNPPGDTVLTWCSNHETRTGSSLSGNVLIVFLDGHAENQPASVVENCRWRTHPKK